MRLKTRSLSFPGDGMRSGPHQIALILKVHAICNISHKPNPSILPKSNKTITAVKVLLLYCRSDEGLEKMLRKWIIGVSAYIIQYG